MMKHGALAFCLWLGVCLGCNQTTPSEVVTEHPTPIEPAPPEVVTELPTPIEPAQLEVVAEHPTPIEPAPPEVVTEHPTSIESADLEVVANIEVYNNFSGKLAGQEWDDNGLKMKFCWCPPGKFTMGSPVSEKSRDADREAQVEVTLTQGFWLGKYEVTQEEYEKVIGKNPSYFCDTGRFKERVIGQDRSRFPVETVTWAEAEEYCQKLTEQERSTGQLPAGWEYCLPTEAQWEYACRAGTKTETAFGKTLSSKQANFIGLSPYNGAELGPTLHRPTTVGSYPENAWGLHDMHGNVWEWCQDWHVKRLPGGADPLVTQTATYRMYRGGSWAFSGRHCRSAFRFHFRPGNGLFSLGFRAALVQSR